MKSFIHLWFAGLAIAGSLASCQPQKDRQDAANTVNLEQATETDAAIADVAYVPLETNEQSLIGNISKIICQGNKFYVLDKFQAQGVFVFSKEGKFLSAIKKPGQGPGEYIELADMDVDGEGNVYVFDNARTNLICYRQGKADDFEAIPVGEHFMEFCCLGDEKFLLRNVFGPEGLKAKLACWDKQDGQLETLFAPRAGEVNEMRILQVSKHGLYRSGGKIYYNERFTPGIYSITAQGEAMTAYSIASPHYITQDLLKDMEQNPQLFMQETTHIKDITSIYENDRYLLCQPYVSPLSGYLLVPKDNPAAARRIRFFKEPRLQGMGAIEGVAEGKFITILNNPARLPEEMRKAPALQALDEDSNPVLALIDLE